MSVGTEQWGLKLFNSFIHINLKIYPSYTKFVWVSAPFLLICCASMTSQALCSFHQGRQQARRGLGMLRKGGQHVQDGQEVERCWQHLLHHCQPPHQGCYGTNSSITNTVILSLAINMTQPPTLWTQPIATRRTTLKKLQQVFKRSLS